MAEAEWYYIDAEQNYVGPIDTGGLHELIAGQFVLPDTYVWAQHLEGWEQVAAVAELAVGAPRPKAADSSAALSSSPRVSPRVSPRSNLPPPPSTGTSPPAPPAQSPRSDGTPAKLISRASRLSSSAIGSGSSKPTETPSADAVDSVPRPGRPRIDGAPDGDDPWDDALGLRILDANRRVRAIISADGEVKDYEGTTLAFIEPNGEVGSPQMEFLGTMHQASGQVIDRSDDVIGEVDQGRGYVKNSQGSVIAEVTREGIVSGNGQRTAGYLQGFTYDNMYQIAAYVLLVDSDFVAGY